MTEKSNRWAVAKEHHDEVVSSEDAKSAHFCSMITRDARQNVAKENIADENEALTSFMKVKVAESSASGSEIYHGNIPEGVKKHY